MEKYYRISRACLENEIAFGADDDLGRIFIADIFVQTLRKYPSYYAEVMQLHYKVYPEFCVNVLRECKQQKLV